MKTSTKNNNYKAPTKAMNIESNQLPLVVVIVKVNIVHISKAYVFFCLWESAYKRSLVIYENI